MLTFNFNTDKEALHEIENGHIDKDIFQHIIETEGFISWGKEPKRLNRENVYQLFEIQTDTRKITHKEMTTKYYSGLAEAFKNCIKRQYEKYIGELPGHSFSGWSKY